MTTALTLSTLTDQPPVDRKTVERLLFPLYLVAHHFDILHRRLPFLPLLTDHKAVDPLFLASTIVARPLDVVLRLVLPPLHHPRLTMELSLERIISILHLPLRLRMSRQSLIGRAT